MACIRHRRGRWVLGYRDATGRRRWETYRTKRQAEDALAAAVPASRQRRFPTVDPDITLAEYSERWLGLCSGLKPQTRETYREKLDLHILPTLGGQRVGRLHRGGIRKLLSDKLTAGLAPATVQLVHATLRSLLASAVEDDVIRANPAAHLGRALRISTSNTQRGERLRALDAEQLEAFLRAAAVKAPGFYPLLFLMSRTGLRLGEALGLRWDDVALDQAELRVERTATPGGPATTPKSGHGRTVDLSRAAVELLRGLRATALEAGLRRRSQAAWLFPSPKDASRPQKHKAVQDVFKVVLKAAKLPGSFSPHSLRHSYASILLAEGVSPAYLQEQLGHARIELTVGTYGRWLRKKAPGALDRMDVTLGSTGVVAERGEMVAAAAGGETAAPAEPTPTTAATAAYGGAAPADRTSDRAAGSNDLFPSSPPRRKSTLEESLHAHTV